MTPLTRTIRRLTTRWKDHGRPRVVSLEPGDSITFRTKGTRKLYRTSLEACFWLAVRADARDQARAAAMARAERRGRGRT
jgi:hypothetical protein